MVQATCTSSYESYKASLVLASSYRPVRARASKLYKLVRLYVQLYKSRLLVALVQRSYKLVVQALVGLALACHKHLHEVATSVVRIARCTSLGTDMLVASAS